MNRLKLSKLSEFSTFIRQRVPDCPSVVFRCRVSTFQSSQFRHRSKVRYHNFSDRQDDGARKHASGARWIEYIRLPG